MPANYLHEWILVLALALVRPLCLRARGMTDRAIKWTQARKQWQRPLSTGVSKVASLEKPKPVLSSSVRVTISNVQPGKEAATLANSVEGAIIIYYMLLFNAIGKLRSIPRLQTNSLPTPAKSRLAYCQEYQCCNQATYLSV